MRKGSRDFFATTSPACGETPPFCFVWPAYFLSPLFFPLARDIYDIIPLGLSDTVVPRPYE